MTIIKIEDIQLIQQQAKESKMEKIFSTHETVLTKINKRITNAAKNNKNELWYEFNFKELLTLTEINFLEEYYQLGGFYAKLDYDDNTLTIQW